MENMEPLNDHITMRMSVTSAQFKETKVSPTNISTYSRTIKNKVLKLQLIQHWKAHNIFIFSRIRILSLWTKNSWAVLASCFKEYLKSNTQTHVTEVLNLERQSASRRNGPPPTRPTPQMIGSALAVTLRSLAAHSDPITTPQNPARHVKIPKIRLTLKHMKQILTSLKIPQLPKVLNFQFKYYNLLL